MNYDEGATPGVDWASGFIGSIVSHPADYCFASVSDLSQPTMEVDRAIHLLGRNMANYWHALLEYAPRIMSVDNPGRQSIPLLWSTESPAAVTEALTLAAGVRQESILHIPVGESIRVNELTVPTLHSRAYDVLTPGIARVCSIDFEPVMAFRDALLSQKYSLSRLEYEGIDVLVTREGNYRNFHDFKLLEDSFRDHGGLVVSLSGMSLAEQICLFQHARSVTSVGGAAWANLVFARAGLRCVNLVTRPQAIHAIHRTVARAMGADMTTVICEASGPSELAQSLSDYLHVSGTVDVDVVHAVLNELSLSQGGGASRMSPP